MSNIYCFLQSTVNIPTSQLQGSSSAVFCHNPVVVEAGSIQQLPSADVCLPSAAAVPHNSQFSSYFRPCSAAPQCSTRNLQKSLVSGTASGSFRSSSCEEDTVDGTLKPAFSFPQYTCCGSGSELAGNGSLLAAATEIEFGRKNPDDGKDDEVKPITVDDLASSLPATGTNCTAKTSSSVQVAAVVDCRAFVAYNVNHVKYAFNASCGDRIAQRRLMSGVATVADFISGGPVQEVDNRAPRDHFKQLIQLAAADGRTIVAYDDNATCMTKVPASHPLRLVIECLKKAGTAVRYLQGGLQAFYSAHPQLCSKPDTLPSRPMLYSPTTPVVEMDVDSTDMSQILCFLYIGNERDAANRKLLGQSGISHVLNVTSHIPQHFQNDVNMTYKRVAATDSCSQNLKQYFEESISFIEAARSSGGKVLVHCQAGVSRSPAIVIAYLMARFNWKLMTAFEFVKSRRNIVAPNLHFMGQLLEFESKCAAGALQHCLNNDGDISTTIPALSEKTP